MYWREKATIYREKRQFPPHVDGRRTKPQLTELGYAAKLKWHVKKGIYFCGRFTFVGFKIVLHFQVFSRLWESLSYVCEGVYICGKNGLRLWAFIYVGGRVYVSRRYKPYKGNIVLE